jgi:hypothetical protein
VFAERLRLPVSWWLIAFAGWVVGGGEVVAGFNLRVAAIVYTVLGVPLLALLIGMGSTRVRVDAAGLHARGATLPLDRVASVTPLDRARTRRLLGPGADPAAHVVARGFIQQAVLIRTTDGPAPYWIVSSRRPEELSAALAGVRAGAS